MPVPALTDQIDDGPVFLAPLKLGNVQFCGLSSAQPATQQDPEQRSISFALECIRVGYLPEYFCLLCGKPVTQTSTEVFRPCDSSDTGGKVGAEQARISGFIGEASHGRESPIDRARRKLARFQVNSITGDDSLVER
jgi:hypothetical protein